MAADDYGFTQREQAQQVRKDVRRPVPGETADERQAYRAESMASWWLEQLNMSLRRYIAAPSVDRKAAMDTLLDDYAKHVKDGVVKPPRFS
jgi:hypothetical protein